MKAIFEHCGRIFERIRCGRGFILTRRDESGQPWIAFRRSKASTGRTEVPGAITAKATPPLLGSSGGVRERVVKQAQELSS